MNKRRLLLFSVFALLHITTSERNFIDGSYSSCNHSSNYLSSSSGFLESEPHRVQRLITRDPESTHQTRRGEEYRQIFGRQRNRILTTPSIEIRGRRNFRDSITIYRPAFSNVINRSRFVSSSSRYNDQINEVNTNRFKDTRINGFNYNDRDRKTRDLLEHVERNTQRHARKDILREYSNYNRYIERKVLPQKLLLNRNVYRNPNFQNIRKIRSDKQRAFNQVVTKRSSGRNTYRNFDNEFSQKELSKIFTSRNKASDDRINLKYDKRDSNEISRRLLIRDMDYLNFLTDNRKRHERAYNKDVNEISRGSRNIRLELREPSNFRDNARNKGEGASRAQSYPQNINRFNLRREGEKSHNRRRTTSQLKYIMAQDIPIDSKIDFERKDHNYNVRNNRELKNMLIIENYNYINRHINSHPQRINFEETNNRMNIFGFRNNNGNRYFKENMFIRNVPKNGQFRVQSFIERSLQKDNEKRTQDNLLMEHSLVRDQIRQSRSIQRNIDNELDRVLRRSRLSFSLASDESGRDKTRRKLTVLRFDNDNIMSGRRRVNRRDQNDDNILNINNIRRNLEKPHSLRENQNRKTTRTNIHVITSRPTLRIVRTSSEDVNYHRSRNVRNEESSTNNRPITRKVDEEGRKTKRTQQNRFINTRQLDTTTEKRYSMIELFRSDVFRTKNINYGSYTFEMTWQYLFYALQFVYFLAIIMQIPKNYENNKQKNRIVAWLTPAEYLKID